MILRPYGIIIGGSLELGLEVVVEDGEIREVRPHTGIPDLYVLSPAFVNAHSHLEYRGLQCKIQEPEYAGWIREITRLKKEQSPEQIRSDSLLAARENVATGVGLILEHSDRPFAGAAMKAADLRGAIMQEVITVLEHESPSEKVAQVERNADENRRHFSGPVYLNPHAFHTVDGATLKWLNSLKAPLSIHAAETPLETELTKDGSGPIAEFYSRHGVPLPSTGKDVVHSLDELGLIREDCQLVHCCALAQGDIELIASRGASVAHCPRSNARLKCPPAPIRELLEAGVRVGLGMDSAASSGPIDMFAEMRSALSVASDRGRLLEAEEVWMMATEAGYDSISAALGERQSWRIEPGSAVPLIKIHVEDATSTEDVTLKGSPGRTEWVTPKN